MLTSHLYPEVFHIGDFIVHHTDKLQSTPTDVGELKLFIYLFLICWNIPSNILHVFLSVMTRKQTLLTYSLLLTLKNILILRPPLQDPPTAELFQLILPLLHHNLSLALGVIYGTLRMPSMPVMSDFLLDFPLIDYSS